MKKSLSLLELILIILIISIIFAFVSIKYEEDKLNLAAKKLTLFLKQARNQAFIDDKNNKDEELWHKKRWTFKFFRCRSSVGGLYYSIYSDENKTGHPSLEESLKDPLTGKRIYSTNICSYRSNTSKYVLLTKEFDITDIKVSCNSTTTIGQISFGSNGEIYSKLSDLEDEYKIEEKCVIELITENNGSKKVFVESRTGLVYEEVM